MLEYAPAGLYLHYSWEAWSPGLWLLDLRTGTITRVLKDQIVEAVHREAAWLRSVNPADPHPLPENGPGGPPPNEVRGFDGAGHPLVFVSDGDNGQGELWLLPAPNEGKRIYTGTGVQLLGDDHGIWIRATDGIYLYTSTNGVRLLSRWVGGLAGSCS